MASGVNLKYLALTEQPGMEAGVFWHPDGWNNFSHRHCQKLVQDTSKDSTGARGVRRWMRRISYVK